MAKGMWTPAFEHLIPINLKGVRLGGGQSSLQASQVLPHDLDKPSMFEPCFVHGG